MKTKMLLVSVMIAFVFVITGCGGEEAPEQASPTTTPTPSEPTLNDPVPTPDEPEETDEPAELSIYLDLPSEIDDDEINLFIREPLSKKYPHITIGDIVKPATGIGRAELVATGNFPDMVYTANANIRLFDELEVALDLVPLAEKHNFDFSKFDKAMVDAIDISSGGNGQLKAMPFSVNWYATFVNQEIFDKFGLPYPDDLTSLEEALELSKRLTREEDGIQYVGLDTRGISIMASALSLQYVDGATLKAQVNTEPWHKVFVFLRNLYDVPGQVAEDGRTTWGLADFYNRGTIAMRFGPTNTSILKAYSDSELKWDVTTYINFEEELGTNTSMALYSMLISSTSEHQDAAFKVLEVMTSDEVQNILSPNGRVPVTLQPDQFETEFMNNFSFLKDKNWPSIFKAKPRPLVDNPVDAEILNAVRAVVATANKRLATENIDVNTLMKQLEEESTQKIAEISAAK